MIKQQPVHCEYCQKLFTPTTARAKFCSDNCRVSANRNKDAVTIANKTRYAIDDYFGSDQYISDIQNFVRKSGNKTSYGGITRDGYTHFVLPDGTKVSIPVSRKTE